MCNFLKEEAREEQKVNPHLRNHKFHPGSKVSAMCSVYENRPTMCRTYPIGLNPSTYTSILKRRENLPMAAQNEGYQICPKDNLEMTDFGLDTAQACMQKNNDLLLSDARTRAHNEAVIRWNSQQERLIEKVVPFFMSVGNSMITSFKAPSGGPPIIDTSAPPRMNLAAEALRKKASL
jgi:hypothetical protein